MTEFPTMSTQTHVPTKIMFPVIRNVSRDTFAPL